MNIRFATLLRLGAFTIIVLSCGYAWAEGCPGYSSWDIHPSVASSCEACVEDCSSTHELCLWVAQEEYYGCMDDCAAGPPEQRQDCETDCDIELGWDEFDCDVDLLGCCDACRWSGSCQVLEV